MARKTATVQVAPANRRGCGHARIHETFSILSVRQSPVAERRTSAGPGGQSSVWPCREQDNLCEPEAASLPRTGAQHRSKGSARCSGIHWLSPQRPDCAPEIMPRYGAGLLERSFLPGRGRGLAVTKKCLVEGLQTATEIPTAWLRLSGPRHI